LKGDGVCQLQSYAPQRANQSILSVDILASHRADVKFLDEDTMFPLGNVTVQLDMS